MDTDRDKIQIVIGSTGTARAIHSGPVMNLVGDVASTIKTARASDVEPGSDLSEGSLQALTAQSFGYLTKRVDDKYRILPGLENHWFVDLSKSGVPVILGPYPPDARDLALKAEHDVLTALGIPVPPSR